MKMADTAISLQVSCAAGQGSGGSQKVRWQVLDKEMDVLETEGAMIHSLSSCAGS